MDLRVEPHHPKVGYRPPGRAQSARASDGSRGAVLYNAPRADRDRRRAGAAARRRRAAGQDAAASAGIDSPLAELLYIRPQLAPLGRRERPRAARRHGRRWSRARGVPRRRAARLRGRRPAAQDLLRPVEDPGRHRHLRRALPGPQQRHPRARDGAHAPLRRAPDRRLPQRLPGLHRPLRLRRWSTSTPERRARHQRGRRHDPRQLARAAGPGGDRRLPRAARRQHPVRDRRRRLAARRAADRRRDRRARACGSRSSASRRRSTTTSRTSTTSFGFRTAFSRATESIRAAHVEARSAPERRRPGEADGPPLAASSPATPRWPRTTPTSC